MQSEKPLSKAIDLSKVTIQNFEKATDEQMRQYLREKGKANLYFFVKVIMGYKDLVAPLHTEICQFLQKTGQKKNKLLIVPRMHFKSTIATLSYPIWRLIHNPNLRILIANETSTNASKFLSTIRTSFESNEWLKWLYPEIIPDLSKTKKWNDEAILINRTANFPEASVESIGVGGAAVSRHYDLIITDDLVGLEASESWEIMKKVVEWYKLCNSLKNHPDESEKLVIGTRWNFGDLYEYILKNESEEFEIMIRSAVENGKPIFPERFSMQSLTAIAKAHGSFHYSCQYLNNPRSPDKNAIREEWIKYFERDGDWLYYETAKKENAVTTKEGRISLGNCNVFIHVDPAFGVEKRSHKTGIIIVAVSPEKKIFIMDALGWRRAAYDTIEALFDLSRRYKPMKITIENFAYQKVVREWANRIAEERGEHLPIEAQKADVRKSKEMRIKGLSTWFERGDVYLQRDQYDLLQEILDWPLSPNNDLIDALAQGPEVWRGIETDEQEEEERENEILDSMNPITGY